MQILSLLSEIDPERFSGQVETILSSLESYGVELQVVASAILIFVLDLVIPTRYSRQLAWVAIGACVLPAVAILTEHSEEHSSRLFLGMIAFDSFSTFFKLVFLLGSIPVILMAWMSKSLHGRRMGEFYGLLLSAVFGAMLMASSTNFLMIFLAVELVSLASYVLVGYRRRDDLGVEAAMKYLIYGTVAAAIMIFGISLYYGLTGSADLGAIADISRSGADMSPNQEAALATTTIVSLLLIFAGIAYKISSVPMHFWAPDAYEGAPTPVTAFLAVLSKSAGFALAIRFFDALAVSIDRLASSDPSLQIWETFIGAPTHAPWIYVIIGVSILTMTIGNLAALWQTNLKRLLAYSSIAHAGYMMMGLTILGAGEGADSGHGVSAAGHGLSVGGVEAITFYILAYLAMNFGMFAVISIVENRTGSCELSAYEGLGRSSPFLGAAMVVFIFSLIGIPPTGGFVGKFQLFMGVLDVGRPEYYVLAIAAGINTAISAYYYLKIAREMYLRDDTRSEAFDYSTIGKLLVAAMVVLTFWLFFTADSVMQTTKGLELEL